MYRMRELFYKLLFKIFVRDKLKRKFLTRCLSKVGIVKYFQLRRLVKEEAFKEPKFKYNIAMTCIAGIKEQARSLFTESKSRVRCVGRVFSCPACRTWFFAV